MEPGIAATIAMETRIAVIATVRINFTSIICVALDGSRPRMEMLLQSTPQDSYCHGISYGDGYAVEFLGFPRTEIPRLHVTIVSSETCVLIEQDESMIIRSVGVQVALTEANERQWVMDSPDRILQRTLGPILISRGGTIKRNTD
ncbi:uncharacterized protein PV07_12781, partial [Cladophialophora immunda]